MFDDNLKFRIYDRFQNNAEFLLYDSALDAEVDAMLQAGDMFTALTFISEVLPEQFFALHGGAANPAVIMVGAGGAGGWSAQLQARSRRPGRQHQP